MARYRKKPVEVEAIRFEPDPSVNYYALRIHELNPERVPEMFFEGYQILKDERGPHCYIPTNHGTTRLDAGDWLITTAAGESYPCRDGEFRRNYEPVPWYPEHQHHEGS